MEEPEQNPRGATFEVIGLGNWREMKEVRKEKWTTAEPRIMSEFEWCSIEQYFPNSLV